MSDKKTSKEVDPYERENQQAEQLLKELESVVGAQKLGDAAYETAKQDLAKKGNKK